jgi:hypothetical protein
MTLICGKHPTVSDDFLKETEWRGLEDKNKTIDLVLTKHNYLRSAYSILLQIEPQEKYYPFIKDMATRNLPEHRIELSFYDIEFALYGLARFKQKDDVKIIKEQMMQNTWRLSYVSFKILKEFPDNS